MHKLLAFTTAFDGVLISMKNIIAHRLATIPWACVYDLKTQTLTGASAEAEELAFPFGDGGDRIWIAGSPSGQLVTGYGIDPAGFDDRFSGLYYVEDGGANEVGTVSGHTWKLRRDPELDSTAKFNELPRLWLLSDPNNLKPTWSPGGTPCELVLPLGFEMGSSPGPRLATIPNPTFIDNPS
jgi:hypothetical protein